MTIGTDLRRQVEERAGYRCEYCRTSAQLTGYDLEIDHIIPQARGGASTADNLCLACRHCNGHKSYRTHLSNPETGQVIPLFNPRLDTWSDHLAWSEDRTQIIGQTDCGRVTVEALQMNAPLIVRTRALWVSVGWHPPVD
jgi:hypothetical protein